MEKGASARGRQGRGRFLAANGDEPSGSSAALIT
jgi:hypothetical protein